MGRVHVRTWRAAYSGLMPAAYLAGLSADERATMFARVLTNLRDRHRLFVAECDGSVVGFAGMGPARDGTDGEEGELYSINVDPDHWGAGAGTALIDCAQRELTELGFTAAILWVHPGNQRARRFYERAGWTCDDATHEAEIRGVVVPGVRHRRSLVGGQLV